MAPKPKTILFKLMSTAGTGFFYVMKKNPVKHPKKMMLKKFDPIVNQHVIFQEIKIKGKKL